MKWYAAVIVMECRVAGRSPELWDEQVRLIRAADAEAAFGQAREIGKSEEHQYENAEGRRVRWKFAGLGALEELIEQRLATGVEVFSRLSREARPRVAQKRQLAAFWSEKNRDKTANELLADELRPFAPR